MPLNPWTENSVRKTWRISMRPTGLRKMPGKLAESRPGPDSWTLQRSLISTIGNIRPHRIQSSATALYQGAVIKTHRDRVRFSPGRKGAAGDAAHRLGFLTPSGDKRTRPVGRLAEALGRRSARLAMRCIAATGAPSREPRQAVSMGLYHCSLVLLLPVSLRITSAIRLTMARPPKPVADRCGRRFRR